MFYVGLTPTTIQAFLQICRAYYKSPRQSPPTLQANSLNQKSLTLAIPETLRGAKNVNRSLDHNHTHFGGDFFYTFGKT